MKKLFAILCVIVLCVPNSSNAYEPKNSKTRAGSPNTSTKKFTYKKGRKYSSHYTRSTQTLATLDKSGKKKSSQPNILSENHTKRKNSSSKHRKIVTASKKSCKKCYISHKKRKRLSSKTRRTSGHYVGLDMVHNKLSYYEKWSASAVGLDHERKTKPWSKGYGSGLGVRYKYAFNLNKFFIAPGLFYERVNTDVEGNPKLGGGTTRLLLNLKVKSRYGVTTDIGYDINDTFSPYLMAGYSFVNYESRNGIATENLSNAHNSIVGSLVYGAGLKINTQSALSFNIEFNVQDFQADTDTNVRGNGEDKVGNIYNFVSVLDAKIKTLKVGVLYNF